MADDAARAGRRGAAGRGALGRGRTRLLAVAGAVVGAALAMLLMYWL